MTKTTTVLPLVLALLLPSCRAFEGLDKVERDFKVSLRLASAGSAGSVAVIAPGVPPSVAAREGDNLFTFVRKGTESRVPAWYCILPARTDVECDGLTSVLRADVPSVQYPGACAPDPNAMLALTPAFNVCGESEVSVGSPDSLVLPFTVRVSGLEAGSRLHAVSFTADSLDITGNLEYDLVSRSSLPGTHPLTRSLSLQCVDGMPAGSDGCAGLSAVTHREFLDYSGPSRIFVSTDNAVYSLSADSLSLCDGELPVDLADGAKKSAGKTFQFNDASLYNALKSSASAKVTASDGTECILEMSSPGCVSRNAGGVICLSVAAGQSFKVPSCSGKEVTGILLNLSGTAPDSARFNVVSEDRVLLSFSASTAGSSGALTALSISDFPEEMEMTDLSGLKIAPAGGTSLIAAFTVTVVDYIDPHKWEDGHIDDSFNNLFDIL